METPMPFFSVIPFHLFKSYYVVWKQEEEEEEEEEGLNRTMQYGNL